MKADFINSITWNYMGRKNCILIEYIDGSSLMIPGKDQMDEVTIKFIDEILTRWHLSQMYDIF